MQYDVHLYPACYILYSNDRPDTTRNFSIPYWTVISWSTADVFEKLTTVSWFVKITQAERDSKL